MNLTKSISPFLLFLLLLTSCAQENAETKVSEVEFDPTLATIDIINHTLPILIPDSAESMFMMGFSQDPDSVVRERENKEILRAHKEFIDSVGMALNVMDVLFVPDSSDAEWMIEKGGGTIFRRFHTDSLSETKLDLSLINDYGNVEITHDYPQKRIDFDRLYGHAGYSKMIFHSNNRKAIFIFNTSRFGSCMSHETHGIEVELIDDKWEIIFNTDDYW